MTINDDFTNKAETEMKMHDAKMMEQAKLKKLAGASLQERISYALTKSKNVEEDALVYLQENHLIQQGENVSIDTIKKYLIR